MFKGKGLGAGVEPTFRGVNKVPVSNQERGMIWVGRSGSSELVEEETHGWRGGGKDMGTNDRERLTKRVGKGKAKDPPRGNREGGDAHSKAVTPPGANQDL